MRDVQRAVNTLQSLLNLWPSAQTQPDDKKLTSTKKKVLCLMRLLLESNLGCGAAVRTVARNAVWRRIGVLAHVNRH
jgi:hypothetical protein